MKDEKTLTTDDLARTGDDMRGHRGDETIGRERQEPARISEPRAAEPARVEPSAARDGVPADTPLFPASESQRFRDRWNDIQAAFVDEPRRAVQDADTLVAESMKRLAEVFAGERQTLERQWDRGDDVTTEDLRIALQRYRSFFGRLLAV